MVLVIPRILSQFFTEDTYNLEKGLKLHELNKKRLNQQGWHVRLIKCEKNGSDIVSRRKSVCESKYATLYNDGGFILDLDALFVGPDNSLDWLCKLDIPAIAQTEKIVQGSHSHTDIDNAFMAAPKHSPLIGKYLEHGFNSYPFPLRKHCSNALNNFTSSFGMPFVALPPIYDSRFKGRNGDIIEHHRGLFEENGDNGNRNWRQSFNASH